METPPIAWTDNPTTPAGDYSTWISTTKYVFNGVNWVNSGWTVPSKFSGERGANGTNAAYAKTFYMRSSEQPTSNPDNAPNDWKVSPMVGVEKLWAAVANFDSDDVMQGEWIILLMEVNEDEFYSLINKERLQRESLEQEVFNVTANYSDFRRNYEERILHDERMVGVLVDYDDASGTITNKAFSYTNQAFSEASTLIDGVDAKIVLEAKRVSAVEGKITDANSQLTVQAGDINLRAKYSEVNSAIAGALSALTPAYSWQFNSDDENFTGAVSHNTAGYVVTSSSTTLTTPTISYPAADNVMFKLRLRKHVGGVFNGAVTGSGFSLAIPEPTAENVWENILIDATGTVGYNGTITSLVFSIGDCDVDSIEIGKRSANDLALGNVTARTTQLEFDMNSNTGIISTLASTQSITDAGYQTDANVTATIDSFNATNTITTRLDAIDSSGTIEKANSASTWVNGAEANVGTLVAAYNTANGIEDNSSSISAIKQSIDALEGTSQTDIISIQGVALENDKQLEELFLQELSEFNSRYKAEKDGLIVENTADKVVTQSLDIAAAKDVLSAHTTELESKAEQITQLFASHNVNKNANENNTALIGQANRAFADEKQATAIRSNELLAKMTNDDATTLASAQEYTRVSVGVCRDADGNITSHENATLCEAVTGNVWTDGSLAEYIRKLEIVKGSNKASIEDIRQVFETVDGNLEARGGMVTDVNGKVTGFRTHNNGSVGNFDILTDVFSVGPTAGNPVLKLNTSDPANPFMEIKAKLTLSDGFSVDSKADIEAQDGQSAYLHLAYANNSDGSSGFNFSNGIYIGTYTDNSPTASYAYTKYSWKKFQGTDGSNGQDGANGVDGQDGANGTDGRDGTNGTNGTNGQNGYNGSDGSRGAGHYYGFSNGWSNAAANSATAGNNVVGDRVTLYTSTWTQTKYWSGHSWITALLVVDGNTVINGSAIIDSLAAQTISVDKLIGEQASGGITKIAQSLLTGSLVSKVWGVLLL